MDQGELGQYIRDVEDFPEPGTVFKDITPLLKSPTAFESVIHRIVGHNWGQVTAVVGIDARGFIIASPVALRLHAAFIPVRKKGKLPGSTRSVAFELEYGEAALEVHDDALGPGDRVLIVDDVLATGGTAAATGELVAALGAEIAGFAFLMELGFLGGAAVLPDAPRMSLLTY